MSSVATQRVPADKAAIQTAAKILRGGGLVAFPTETVYGLGASAVSGEAVAKLYAAKGRPSFNPLISHVASLEAAKCLAVFNEDAEKLARAFWPGPLTLLLPRKALIPDLVTSGLERVGLRCPDHALTRKLLRRLNFPLAAPSANPFGYISPTTATHVNDQLGTKVSYILDGGPCRIGLESTIVGFEDGETVVYRLGGIAVKAIADAVGPVRLAVSKSADPQAPGQLSSHYAPHTRVVLGLPASAPAEPAQAFGVLSFSRNHGFRHELVLSPEGDTAVAAQRLFSCLRELDAKGLDVIHAELAPDHGLGPAINDRLIRASF